MILTTLLCVVGALLGTTEGLPQPEPIGQPAAETPTAEPLWKYNDQNRPGEATSSHSCNQVRPVPAHLRQARHMYPSGLDYFYQKYTEAYGIPVLGSNRLSDTALRRACYTVRFLFADRPEVRQAYYKAYGRFALMATTEVTTNIPEHRDMGSGWDQRARGLGATLGRPVSTGGEENALCLPREQDRYRVEDILLHEFSHGLMNMGRNLTDPTFHTRLMTQYNYARSSGLWAGTYALSTYEEYWAEGAQSFFGVNGYAKPPDGIHNHINTNEKLRGYDPGLYKILQETFSCGNKYIKRCEKNREAEQNQSLRMDCREDGGGGVTQPPKGCADSHQKCHEWAKQGECVENEQWMLANCKKSCRVC